MDLKKKGVMPSSVHVATVTTKEDSIAKATAAAAGRQKNQNELLQEIRVSIIQRRILYIINGKVSQQQ